MLEDLGVRRGGVRFEGGAEEVRIEPDREPFVVRLHDSAYETQRLDLLIQNLESQTELDVAVEKHPDDVLIVSRNPS